MPAPFSIVDASGVTIVDGFKGLPARRLNVAMFILTATLCLGMERTRNAAPAVAGSLTHMMTATRRASSLKLISVVPRQA